MRMEYHRSKGKRLFNREKEEWPPVANATEGLNRRRAKIGDFYFNEWMSLITLLGGISWHDRSRSQTDLD